MYIPISNKTCRKILADYPYRTDSSGSYLLGITDVKVFWSFKEITCWITTHQPGILIGKGGKQIGEI